MENKQFKVNHQGPSWSHFKARDLHRKKLSNNQNDKFSTVKKEKTTPFSWLIDTVNPLNHVPVVSTVKNFITKSNKSLDIIQSAVGGFLFAGPLGVIKGLGGWAVNKITNNFIAKNSGEKNKNTELESNLKIPNKKSQEEKKINDRLSFFYNHNQKNTNEKLIAEKLLATNSYINNFEIFNNKNPLNKSLNNYSEIKSHKTKINISA